MIVKWQVMRLLTEFTIYNDEIYLGHDINNYEYVKSNKVAKSEVRKRILIISDITLVIC